MAEASSDWSEIQGAARDLWDAMGDRGTPTADSPASAVMGSEFKRLTDEGHSEDEVVEVIGGEILGLVEDSE